MPKVENRHQRRRPGVASSASGTDARQARSRSASSRSPPGVPCVPGRRLPRDPKFAAEHQKRVEGPEVGSSEELIRGPWRRSRPPDSRASPPGFSSPRRAPARPFRSRPPPRRRLAAWRCRCCPSRSGGEGPGPSPGGTSGRRAGRIGRARSPRVGGLRARARPSCVASGCHKSVTPGSGVSGRYGPLKKSFSSAQLLGRRKPADFDPRRARAPAHRVGFSGSAIGTLHVPASRPVTGRRIHPDSRRESIPTARQCRHEPGARVEHTTSFREIRFWTVPAKAAKEEPTLGNGARLSWSFMLR